MATVCPFAAQAQDYHDWVEVGVYGGVQGASCTPGLIPQLLSGSHNTANSVTLPDVSYDQLGWPGATWGDVVLVFRAVGCTGHDNMWVHFTSPDVDADGRIIPDNSSQLRFEIRDGDNAWGDFIRVGGSAADGDMPDFEQGTVAWFSGSAGDSFRFAEKPYTIRYYAQTAVTEAGTYSATVTANFIYY